MASVVKSELLALIQKRVEVSREVSIETVVIAFFSTLKAAYCEKLQTYILLSLVMLNKSLTMLEKPWMNL